MATIHTAPTRCSFQSGSKPSLSSSSSTTLRDEDIDHNDAAKGIEHDNAAKVNVQQRRKRKANIRDPRVELGYQKVLRTMTTQHVEPVVQLDTTTNTLRKSQEPGNVKLLSWQRALRFIGMKKFATRSNKETLPVFNINDTGVARVLGTLMAEFGRGTNSSFLDDSYSIYLQGDERAAICFKVLKNVAVMYGDPLCAADRVDQVFEAFRNFCRQQRWHVAVVGAGPTLAAYAKKQYWRTMEFAVEQILNPVTNSVLDETSGKTITRTNRKLVKDGIKLFLYEPSQGLRPQLEQELMKVYNSWRDERRQRNAPQAYSAVINPFALSGVSRYMYTRGSDGRPNSLAGLIRLGANAGYLLEPCIQLPDAPKGVTGFLVTHAMGLLRDENVTYMTFGLEALPELGEITRMPSLITDASRRIYQITFDALGLRGRKIFHESFHPEKDQQVPSYLLFPPGLLHINVYQAVLDATHISAYEVWSRSQAARSSRRKLNRIAKSMQLSTNSRPQQHEGDEQCE
jgi:hypothetical protein